jgi:SAM-dependent methyltransferase/uncharacterized protein YbaR (Trm112 family)
MRYALLDLVACQHCHAPLTSFTAREVASEMPQGILPGGTRIAPGPGVGPAAPLTRTTPLGAAIERHARAATDPARNFTVEVEEGLLICAECGRWYPIIGQLPEILPDHLRTRDRDLEFLRSIAPAIPADLHAQLAAFTPSEGAAHDAGTHHKTSEMSIGSKIDDPHFFGPGYTSPYNLWNPEFTLYLIALFGAVLPVLEIRKGETVVDSGCGYAWTTEWFHRAGVPAVGVDITRLYPEIGIKRMGANRPHLVIGDVENLPLRDASADAVLAYESFHHIPDRPRAMAGYDRILREGGRVVLAEPGAAHEHAEGSISVMEKYGILERGMELADVHAYAAGTRLTRIDQIFLAKLTTADIRIRMHLDVLRARTVTEGHVFRLARGDAASTLSSLSEPRRRIWPVVKRYIKAALLRVGLD